MRHFASVNTGLPFMFTIIHSCAAHLSLHPPEWSQNCSCEASQGWGPQRLEGGQPGGQISPPGHDARTLVSFNYKKKKDHKTRIQLKSWLQYLECFLNKFVIASWQKTFCSLQEGWGICVEMIDFTSSFLRSEVWNSDLIAKFSEATQSMLV